MAPPLSRRPREARDATQRYDARDILGRGGAIRTSTLNPKSKNFKALTCHILNPSHHHKRPVSELHHACVTIPHISPRREGRNLSTEERERILTIAINNKYNWRGLSAPAQIAERSVTPLPHRVGIVEMRMSVDT
jgi:hypothetical protein